MDKRESMVTLVQILIDSLEKKYKILTLIEEKSKEQVLVLKQENFQLCEWDKLTEDKGKLVKQVILIDQGFESIYERIRADFIKERDSYLNEIKQIQDLIQKIMAKGAVIEVLETRNKSIIENDFHKEKREIYCNKTSSNVAAAYKNHANKQVGENQQVNLKR